MTGLPDAERARWLLAAAGLAVGVAMVVGSLELLAVAAVFAGLSVASALPRGGLTPAIAIGLLWANAGVVASKQLGAPGVLGLLPHLLLGAVVVGRVVVHQRPIVVTATFRALLVYGVALMIAALAALDAAPVQGAVVTFVIEGLLLWFLVINAIDDSNGLERVMFALLLASAFLGILSIIQFTTGTYDNDYFGFAQVGPSRLDLLESGKSALPRLAGSIGEENRYAQSLLVVIPMGVALVRSHRRFRLLATGLLVPVVAGVALTGSRGAVVGLGATIVVMTAMRLITVRAVGLLAVVAVSLVLVIPGYGDRIFNTVEAGLSERAAEEADSSTLSRVTTNLAALNMLEDHLLLGVGPDGFPELYEPYAERVGLNVKDEARQPHNLYLGVGAELGIIGLVAFMVMPLMLLVSLTRSWRALRALDPSAAAITAGLVGAIVAYLASGVFLHLAFDRYYWTLLAICDVGARVARRRIGAQVRSGRSNELIATGAT